MRFKSRLTFPSYQTSRDEYRLKPFNFGSTHGIHAIANPTLPGRLGQGKVWKMWANRWFSTVIRVNCGDFLTPQLLVETVVGVTLLETT
jgi:hypothetical protein